MRRFSLLLVSLFACTHPTSVPTAVPSVAGTPSPTLTPPVAPPAAPEISGYDKPPQYVLDVLHAPAPARPMISPTRDRILLVSWVSYPSITQVAEPYLKMAGVRLEPRTRRKHDTDGGYGVTPCAQKLAMVDIASTRETPIATPSGCLDGFAWAPDGARFAFRNTTHDSVELWIGDAASGQVHRLGDARLNPMLRPRCR